MDTCKKMENAQIAIAKQSFQNTPYCGDECAYWLDSSKIILCVADGLGHGKQAQYAAKAAVDYVSQHLREPLADIIKGCDVAIRDTRGVAMGIGIIDLGDRIFTYGGVGNTRGFVARQKPIRFSSSYGIVGAGFRKINIESIHLFNQDIIIMYTDGIQEMIQLSCQNQTLDDLNQLAENVLAKWGRQTDDAAVLVCRLA